MSIRIVLACALVSVFAPAAADETPAFDLERLTQIFAAIPQSQARFTEVRRLAALDAPVTSSGVLSFKAPDRLERQTRVPHIERYVIEGDMFAIEREVEGQNQRREFRLAEFPPLRAFLLAVRATLAGDRATLDSLYGVALEGTETGWTLRLRPKKALLGTSVREIRFRGRGSEIDRIETDEAGGDSSRMTLSPIEPPPAPATQPGG
jgi:outer membrane lipoprotein-sorting protein